MPRVWRKSGMATSSAKHGLAYAEATIAMVDTGSQNEPSIDLIHQGRIYALFQGLTNT